MSFKKLFLGILILALFQACGSSGQKSSAPQSTTLIDTLTDFSIAINANNFKKAVDFLVETEKRDLVDPGGNVPVEVQKKLKALKLQILIKNPRIKLSGSKLVGILSALPSLEHGDPDAGSNDPLFVDTQLQNLENQDESDDSDMAGDEDITEESATEEDTDME